jgi:drug/metabolite transporter (DMT)-like permease
MSPSNRVPLNRDERRIASPNGPRAEAGSISRGVWLALGIIYLVWGSTYLAIRVAVETIPPFLMSAVRFLVAGALLFAFAVRRGSSSADPIGPRQWGAATLIGGMLLLWGNGGVVWAEQHVQSSVAALIIAGVPLWMALIATAIGEERLRSRSVAGLLVGFGGTALLVLAGSKGGSTILSGLLVLVVASVCWAAGSVASRRVPLPKRPLVATGMEMLGGGGLLLIAAAVTGEFGKFHPEHISNASLAGFAYLIVFGSWLAFSAYVWLLQNAAPSLVSTYAYVNPVIAVILGVLILDERFTAATATGAALIVAAVALIVWGQGRRLPVAEAGVGRAA